MKFIFERTNFPSPPGGDCYEWKKAETIFEIAKNGRYIIGITASCRNGKQNETGDDDDLRISINGYEFGKAEAHAEKKSYRGFGTCAAWNGASLKGSTKTVYFFVDLDEELESLFWFNEKRQHVIKFYADGKPKIHNIKVYELEKNQSFILENQNPPSIINTSKNGLPWISFVFLGVHPRDILLKAKCRSYKQKAGTDGDNIKVVVNGNILKNPYSPTSNKYKNFYFSGDQTQGKDRELKIKANQFNRIENALELWYDQTPVLEKMEITFFENRKQFLEELMGWDTQSKRLFYYSLWNCVEAIKKIAPYTGQFLLHSLQEDPQNIIFDYNDPFIDEIKKDKNSYNKILSLVKEKIKKGELKGEIITGGTLATEINFENFDLATSIHGVKKIQYEATAKEDGSFEIDMKLIDIYDFDRQRHTGLKSFMVYLADKSEELNVIKNYKIIIKIKEELAISK